VLSQSHLGPGNGGRFYMWRSFLSHYVFVYVMPARDVKPNEKVALTCDVATWAATARDDSASSTECLPNGHRIHEG